MNYGEKSTAFLLDELITTHLRMKTSKIGSERYREQSWKRFEIYELLFKRTDMDFLNVIISFYTGEESTEKLEPILLDCCHNLFNCVLLCWEAQERIMDESFSDKERLDWAIEAQRQNALRSKYMIELDTFMGEGYRSVSEKTYYSYFDNK